MRKEIKEMLFVSLILTLILSVPGFFGDDPLVQYGASIICNLLFLLYLGNRLFKAGVFDKPNQEPNWKHLAILSPTVLFFAAVPLSCLLEPSSVYFINYEYFWLYLINDIVIAINEELIFRLIIYKRIQSNSRLIKIVTSAFIFCLFDIILFFQTLSIIYTIESMISSFILGLFVGALVEYTHSIYPAIIFHFLDSFFESTFLTLFYPGFQYTLILQMVLPVIALIYLALTYVFYFRKKE